MILLYSLGVCSLLITGAVFSSFMPLSHIAKNYGQHFLAGILIGCVSIELIPNITHAGIDLTAVLGFFFGIILMLVLDNISARIKNKKLATLVGLSIDLFVDGFLIAIAFIVSYISGIIVSFAFAIEVFFLGLMLKLLFNKKALPLLILVLSLLFGSLLGMSSLLLPSNSQVFLLAFGVSALLYVTVEQLIKEAHKTKDSSLSTILFFGGFFLIFLLKSVID